MNNQNLCDCNQLAQPNSMLCLQCERALIDLNKPPWAVRGRDGNETHGQVVDLPDVQENDVD